MGTGAGGDRMIGYLRGLVIERRSVGDNAVELVIDVGGVGYRVLVPPQLAASVVPGDGEVGLAVHTHVREGAITLYGFTTSDQRQNFELLLGAHGVGPSLALAIVSVHPPERLAEIVSTDDVDALTLVPGIGKKTATRLLVELKARYRLPRRGSQAPPCFSAVTARPRSPPTCRRRSRSSATAQTRSERPCERSRAKGRPKSCCGRLSWNWPRDDEPATRDPGRADRRTGSARARRLRRAAQSRPPPTTGNSLSRPTSVPGVSRSSSASTSSRERLSIVLEAARRRGQSVDHLLFAGPPGLGKTTLAGIVAAEMRANLRITSGPALIRSGDVAAILTGL